MNSGVEESVDRLRRVAILVAFAALSVLSLAAGCGPKLEDVFEDPSFKSAQTMRRPVAVGGFVWSGAPVERETEVCDVLGGILWDQLSGDMGEARVRGRSWVSEQLDSAAFRDLLAGFDATGRIDSVGANRLSAVFRTDSVLIVLARLTEDRTDTTENTYSAKSEEWTREIKRTVRARLLVFDPILGKTVWWADVSNSDTDTESIQGSSSLGELLGGLAFGLAAYALFGGSDDPEPPPIFESSPDFGGIVQGICGQMSKALQGKGD